MRRLALALPLRVGRVLAVCRLAGLLGVWLAAVRLLAGWVAATWLTSLR